MEYKVWFRKLNEDTKWWLDDSNKLHLASCKARTFKCSEDAYVCISNYLLLNSLIEPSNKIAEFHVQVY